MFKFSVSIILCALASRCSFGQQNDDKPMDIFRLPNNTEPVTYDLQFYPIFDGEKSTFTGVANITFTCIKPDRLIVLNIKDLTVDNITVTDVGSRKNMPVKNWEYKANNEQLEINLESMSMKNRMYWLIIRYNGNIRNDLTGLYLSSYKENNQTK